MRKSRIVSLVTGLSALLLGLSAEHSHAGTNTQSCALSTNLSSGAFCPGDELGLTIDSITPNPGIGYVCIGLDDIVLGCQFEANWSTGPLGSFSFHDTSTSVPVGTTI